MRKQKCLRETGDKLFPGSTSALVFVDRTFAKILSESNHKWNNFTEGKMWYLKGFTVVRHGEPWTAIERWKRRVRLLKADTKRQDSLSLYFSVLIRSNPFYDRLTKQPRFFLIKVLSRPISKTTWSHKMSLKQSAVFVTLPNRLTLNINIKQRCQQSAVLIKSKLLKRIAEALKYRVIISTKKSFHYGFNQSWTLKCISKISLFLSRHK